MSCGVGCRRSSDPELLWLWRRRAAVAPIQSLAWELPYAVGVALKSKTKQNKKTVKKVFQNLFRVYLFIFFVLFVCCLFAVAVPVTRESSPARDQTRATAVTQAAAVTMPDP